MTRPPYGPPPGYGAPQWGPVPGHVPPYGAPPPYGVPHPHPHAPPYGAPLPPPRPYGPPGVPPYGYPRPPRSGGGALAAVLGVFGVFVVVGLLVVAGLASGTLQNSATGGSTGYTPSFTYTPTTTPSTSAPSTGASSTSRSYTTSRAATTTRPAGPQPVLELGNHPLFTDSSLGLTNARCNLTQFSLTPSVALTFFQSAAACLDQMWRPNLAARDLPFESPGIEVASTTAELSSPCGTGSSEAFYCSTSKTIYMSTVEFGDGGTSNPGVEALGVFAHEYGHHVQHLTGLLRASHNQRYSQGSTTDAGLDTGRRMELQAGCFAGMYLGSAQAGGTFTPDVASIVLQNQYNRGDHPGMVRDHGSPQHNGWWYEHGYSTNRNFECNTWLSPADAVS